MYKLLIFFHKVDVELEKKMKTEGPGASECGK